jgi:PAS domain S-box-containing protein
VIATRKDGTTFDQELSLSINEDDLTICISKDISDRKQAEISLLNYSQQVEDLYNNAPCGYCSLDADSHITGINNTALLWLDYTREEVIGQPITQFISVDSKKIYEGESQLLRQSGQLKRLNYEIVLGGSDGGRMTVLFCEEAQKDADHKVIGSRITITDIRQRIKVEKLKQQQLTGANLLRQISDRIRQTLDLPTIFSTACHEVRQALKADRVGIFQFYPEFNYNDGQFIAESIVGDYPSALNTNVHDHCFGDNFAHLYSQGRYYAVTDIEEGNLSTCHQDILRQFQVRSNLVVPLIKSENELWGLLCIHQCSQPRHWHIPEIELVQQIANQLAIAINQASLYQRIQDELRIRQQAEVQIKRQLEQQRTLAAITEIVRESLDETTILSTVTQHVKNLLQCDRVIIFRLYPDGCSQIVEESVSSEFVSLKHQQWKDEVWSDEILELYWQGKPRIVADVTQDQWTDCLIEYSQEGQIQSKVVAPILQDAQADDNHRWVAPRAKKLWGIIVAHACTEKRVWQDTEAELLQQIANSVAISIQQASFLEQLQQELGDRQLAEQELAERNQQLSINNVELERATRLKDEFLANMSHELRTPLNAILGLTESLQEEIFGIVNERQQKALQTIEKSGTHLLNLINDILDVAKIASGEMKLECSSVGVEQLCISSLSFLRQQAHKKQIQIITKIPSQLPNLYIDEGRIRQVLLNLLTNAIKFTPVGGTVKLNASLMLAAPDTNQPNYLRFSIIDTGIGISPENLSRLFKPFIQIDSALNRKQMGTGLGLALVKQIVELHGGKVGLTSELGVGSCFTVDLPYSQEVVMPNLSPEISPSSSPLPDSSHSSSHLVLLAEDNLANVATISSYLEAKGYRLICANNGQEAIDLTILHQPNLIVMDIQMPDLDGLEAIRQIRQRENFREIPIIALTALTMQGDRERCLEAGANEYLSKPVRLKNLHNLITSLLGCV